MSWLIQVLGLALMLLALADVFLVVLYARSGTGFLAPRLQQYVWRFMVRLVRGRGERWQRLLSFAGPIMMVLSVAAWVFLLLVGSSLVVWPELGSSVRSTSGATPTDFSTAFYYAGISLTTLGMGDLVPTSPAMKLLTVLLAAFGFSIVTLTLTYFMSVYSALVRRNVTSKMLHYMTGGTGHSVDLICGWGRGDKFDETRSQMIDVASGVLDVVESNEAYPVLQYFRMNHSHYSMARVALITLDTASLIKAALSPAHSGFVHSSAVQLLWGSGLNLLGDAESDFVWEARSEKSIPDDPLELRKRFDEVLESFRSAGISTAEDVESAFAEYLRLRRQWIERVQSLARCTGFDWGSVSGPERGSGGTKTI